MVELINNTSSLLEATNGSAIENHIPMSTTKGKKETRISKAEPNSPVIKTMRSKESLKLN